MQGALFNFIETDPNGCYDLLLSDPWGRTLAQHSHALAVEEPVVSLPWSLHGINEISCIMR